MHVAPEVVLVIQIAAAVLAVWRLRRIASTLEQHGERIKRLEGRTIL
jgi:hypothetical protein